MSRDQWNKKSRKRVPAHLLCWESPSPFLDVVHKTERMLVSSSCSALDAETQPLTVALWLTRQEVL